MKPAPSPLSTPPASQGYRLPAEWEPHEATWIAWPHNADDWPGKFAAIPFVYCEIVRHLHRVERVRILVNHGKAEQQVRKLLQGIGVDLERIDFHTIATDRCWTRDYGPLFLIHPEGKLAITDWLFNGWAKYKDWKKDNEATALIARSLKCPAWQPAVEKRRIVLEGGSIEVNGQGLLLTTEECLLDTKQARNPSLERRDLERLFADYLGIRKVLWLGRGLAGDDTHGHIDDLARFVGPRTVLTVVEDNVGDPNYEPLRENLDRLHAMTDLEGRPLELVTLPMPAPVIWEGQRLPASYANFYIASKLVLMPTFNDANDCRAMAILADLFPGRSVIGIHAVDLLWGLGTLHCLTLQQPRV